MAGRLGITEPTLSVAINRDDWTFGRAPWTAAQVQAIRVELADRRARHNATSGKVEDEADGGDETAADAIAKLVRNPEKAARVKLIVERTAKIKLERELLAGGYVAKADVDKDMQSRVFSVRAKLGELPLRASLIAHKTETECERILIDWAKEVCDYYANGGN